MAKIAREAGISKALLYHYFPSKEAYFVATLEEKAEELRSATAPDPALPPFEQLSRSLDAYLGWIEENAEQLRQDDPHGGRGARGARDARPRARRRPRSASSPACAPTAPPSPVLRTAVRGWLGFMDGALPGLARAPRPRPRALHGLLLGDAARRRARPPKRARLRRLDLLEVDDEDERLVRRRSPAREPCAP